MNTYSQTHVVYIFTLTLSVRLVVNYLMINDGNFTLTQQLVFTNFNCYH